MLTNSNRTGQPPQLQRAQSLLSRVGRQRQARIVHALYADGATLDDLQRGLRLDLREVGDLITEHLRLQCGDRR